MTPQRELGRFQVSPLSTAVGTIVGSAIWLVAACEYFATSGTALDWSRTPMIWVTAVVLCPAICFSGVLVMLQGRTRKGTAATGYERWALGAAFMPVTVGSLLAAWAVRVLFLMCGL